MHGAYSETWWWQCPYVGLHLIDGIMNSQMYCSILKEKMLPSLRALGRRALSNMTMILNTHLRPLLDF